MMRQKQCRQILFLAVAALVGAAADLRAQVGINDPRTMGTMPAQMRRDGKTDILVVSASASAGVDDNGGYEVADPREPEFQGRQVYSDVSTALSYNGFSAKQFGVQLFAVTGARYYDSIQQVLSTGENVGGNLAFPLWKTATVFVTGGFSYSPNYALALFPGLVPNPDSIVSQNDLALVQHPAYTSGLSAGIAQALGRRASVSMSYGMRRSDFVREEDPSLQSTYGQGMFRYRLTRNVGFHAGYARRVGEYNLITGERSQPIEDIDIGLDYNYNRGLSLTRRTTLSFGSGSSMSQVDGQRHFSVTGIVNLDQQLGRYSHLGFTYNRGVQLLEGFVKPAFTDTVSANAASAIGRRVQLAATASYSFGEVGLSPDSDYSTWNGTGRVSFAVTTQTLLYASYGYSTHNVGRGVELLTNVPYSLDRTQLRVGASVRVPMIRKRLIERK